MPAALDDLELPRGWHVAYPTVLSYYYDRMMGDDRGCLWDMYVVERVQLTAITLLADLAGGRVHRISLALLHRLERLLLENMAAGSAGEHARLQRLLHGFAVLLPKWGAVVEAAGFPVGQTPLPAEGDDAANPYGFRLALDAGGVEFPSRAERASSRSATARTPPEAAGGAGAGHTRGGGSADAPGGEAAARSESLSWQAESPTRSSPGGRGRAGARRSSAWTPPAEASTTRTRTRTPGRESPGRSASPCRKASPRRSASPRRAPSPRRSASPRRSPSPLRRRMPTPPPQRGRAPPPRRGTP